MADDVDLDIDLNAHIRRDAEALGQYAKADWGLHKLEAEHLVSMVTTLARKAVAREIMAWLESAVYRSHSVVGSWELADRMMLLTGTAPADWHEHPGASLRKLYTDSGITVDGEVIPFRVFSKDAARAEMLEQLHAGLAATPAPVGAAAGSRPWITTSALRRLGVTADIAHLREFFGKVDVQVVDR
jgi:hypothetical protein